MQSELTLERIDQLRELLAPSLRPTPTLKLDTSGLLDVRLSAKFELWQITGSFKARAALANCLALDDTAQARGVTAVSAGNHAIATAWAAASTGLSAKVVMTASAPPLRVARAQAYGAEVVSAATVHDAFARAEEIVATEGRTMIHPFEGWTTACATAGVGRELIEDADELDAVVVPIGGGGLAAGVAAAVKLSQPRCAVFGVEPVGADSMSRSLAAGKPVSLDQVDTIADSLGAPMALPISYTLCAGYIDEVVRVEDEALRDAMREMYTRWSLVVEPACAAALAAILGPLRSRLTGARVGIVLCGSNIDVARWQELTA